MFALAPTIHLAIAAFFLREIEALFGLENLFGGTTPVTDYQVYWNVPTFMCHKYGMNFDQVSRDYGIKQNPHDEFRGSEIVMLYDPGMFPALLESPNGSVVMRNGGVPQKGNLTEHLEALKRDVAQYIPDSNFRGLAVIDFESWRPIYRQNWASLAQYKVVSEKIVKKKHRSWSDAKVKAEATRQFEKWGKLFMDQTLKTAQSLRPQATWGYYAFPYCFNLTPNQPSANCDPKAMQENDGMAWLFTQENVILPSVYLQSTFTGNDVVGLIGGRVTEAMRMAKKSNPRTKVFVYTWYKYQDNRNLYVTREDVVDGIREIIDRGADGYVIWGSSSDLNTKDKCQSFLEYLNEVLGPAIIDSRGKTNRRVATDPEVVFSPGT